MGDDRSGAASPSRRAASAACVLLIAIGFVLRLAPIGRYVTPDEPNWVHRSTSFRDAVAAGDWSAIPPTGHPGVTTMWLGAAGITARRLLNPEGSLRHLDWIRNLAWLDPASGAAFPHLAFFLSGGRIAVALVSSLSLAVLFLLTSHLFDRTVALVSVGLLAFDPFLIGHSGLLHTDALLSTFGLLTLVSALNGLRRPSVGWWAVTGFFGGLALLTKSPALVAVAFVPLLLGLRCLQSGLEGTLRGVDCLRAMGHGALFVVFLALTFFALHPEMWTDPMDAFLRSFSLAGRHLTSVQHAVFFAGETVLDPGPAFYPTVLLFRISPLVLVGLVSGLSRLSAVSSERRFAFVVLLLFAVLFGVGVTLSTKKHDRYLLPIFPPLGLAAALGIGAVLDRQKRGVMGFLRSVVHRVAPLSAATVGAWLVVFLQAVIAFASAPYPLTYYNPLLGGLGTASRIVPTGWGEGWGAAARRLNEIPEAEKLKVAATSIPSFAPVFRGEALPLTEDNVFLADYVVVDDREKAATDLAVWDRLNIPSERRPTIIYEHTGPLAQADWLEARVGADDLIILDASTPLRHRYSGPAELFSADTLPDEVAWSEWLVRHVPGRDIVWLVASPGASPITSRYVRRQLEAMTTVLGVTEVASATITKLVPVREPRATSPVAYRAAFGGQVALIDGAVPESVEGRRSLGVTLRWRTLANAGSDHRVVVTLRSGGGHDWAHYETLVRNEVNFPTSAWRVEEWSEATYGLRLPPDMPPDRYRVEVSLYEAARGARLGAVGPGGTFLGTRVPVGSVDVGPPKHAFDPDTLDVDQRLDVPAGSLRLVGIGPVPSHALSGDSLSLEIWWQADTVVEADYRVRMRLAGPRGGSGLELATPLSPYATSQWRVGDCFRSHYEVKIPPSLPPGQGRLTLNVLDEQREALWARDRVLATVEILPRDRAFTPAEDVPHETDIAFGQSIHLRGYAAPSTAVRAGQAVPLTLLWQADGPTEESYTLFVHLLDPQGNLQSQVDRIPGNGAAPTSSWAEGQFIVDKVALSVPPEVEAGVYRIAIGFYDAAYGERLPVAGGQGRTLPQNGVLLPTEVEVVR